MKQLDRPLKSVNVTGMFMATYDADGQPVLFMLEGVHFLPIFSTVEKLTAAMASGKVEGTTRIKQITDHDEFIESVMGKVRLMLDPWHTERGTTRFTEILPAKIGERN